MSLNNKECCVCSCLASYKIRIGTRLFYFCPAHVYSAKAQPLDPYKNRFKSFKRSGTSVEGFLKYMSKSTIVVETDGEMIFIS